MANGGGSGGAMALARFRAVLGRSPQLQLSSWFGLCGKEGQESESRTPMSGGRKQGQGLWTGRDNQGQSQVHQRQTSPDKCGETLRMQGRDQLHRKASILRVHIQACKHSFIHSFPK